MTFDLNKFFKTNKYTIHYQYVIDFDLCVFDD